MMRCMAYEFPGTITVHATATRYCDYVRLYFDCLSVYLLTFYRKSRYEFTHKYTQI